MSFPGIVTTSTSFSFSPAGPSTVTSDSSFTVLQTSTAPVSTQPASNPVVQTSLTSSSSSLSTSSSSIADATHVVTALVTTQKAGTSGAPAQATTIVVTSTESAPIFPSETTTHSTSSHHASSTSSGAAALSTTGPNAEKSSGLSPGSRIAVAVVVPVVAVAFIVLALLFWWRKRKQRKDAEELRRREVEEYGFNPNEDPTLPTIGGASSNGDEPSEMAQTDGAGYRGWGTTSTNRKASTTLSSGNGIGIARSGSGSDPGGYQNGSPTAGTTQNSDVQSNDPLVNDRPMSGDSETIGALGAAPAAGGNRQDPLHRGPSNASSAYSGAHRSDTSGEGMIPGGAPGQQYYSEGMFYDEGMPQHGPYGDGSYGGGQPVIRDVQARRNTRIENPSVFPPQGNAGIAQNF